MLVLSTAKRVQYDREREKREKERDRETEKGRQRLATRTDARANKSSTSKRLINKQENIETCVINTKSQ